MGTCESNDFEKPWNDESFYWKILKVNMTWMTWWFWQKLMIGFGCDTIPIFEYPHNTWLWVGLSWKFMCLSMGSLWTHIIGVTLEAASVVEKWCELRWIVRPSPVQFPGWLAVFTGRPSSWGEVPVLGYVIERLWLVVRTRSVINQGQLTLTDYCKCCGTSVRPLQRVELFE